MKSEAELIKSIFSSIEDAECFYFGEYYFFKCKHCKCLVKKYNRYYEPETMASYRGYIMWSDCCYYLYVRYTDGNKYYYYRTNISEHKDGKDFDLLKKMLEPYQENIGRCIEYDEMLKLIKE